MHQGFSNALLLADRQHGDWTKPVPVAALARNGYRGERDMAYYSSFNHSNQRNSKGMSCPQCFDDELFRLFADRVILECCNGDF